MKTFRLASFMGAGKSVWCDSLIAEFARAGKTILLAVPNGELAMEHKKRLRGLGIEAYCLMSHKNLFKYITDFVCPSEAEIQEQQKLGVSSQITKKQFCKGCPFRDECPYPDQYKKAKEPDHRVIIIQHAHFSCKETIWSLINEKPFDVMFIDESFIDSVYNHVKCTPMEVAILESIGYLWTDTLAEWLKEGGSPHGSIEPDEAELDVVRTVFGNKNTPWRIPDFIRFFNNEVYYDVHTGLFDFHPIPEIPVRVFLCATTSKELLEIILDCEVIEYGAGDILDYRQYNPENKVIQILDASMSVSSLEKEDGELLYSWMELVGDTGRNDHPNDKLLVTVYERHREAGKEWLGRNYPDVLERATFNLLSLGTNAYEDYPVQYLFAGVHFRGNQYLMTAYDIRCIMNYWNRRKNRPQIQNIFPIYADGKDSVSVEMKEVPVTRIEPDGLIQYNVPSYEPVSYINKLIFRNNVGKTQQAIRTRLHTGAKRTIYIGGNLPMEGFMVNSTRLKDSVIGYQFK